MTLLNSPWNFLQVCAFYEHPSKHGRVAVLGSAHMFSDQYIDREENNKIKDVIFHFLTANDFKLNQIDADDPEVWKKSKYIYFLMCLY